MTKKRVTMPPGCKCNPYDWPGDAAITPICERFQAKASVREFCYYCGHLAKCHAVAVADEVNNRPADERDVDSLHKRVGLLLSRLGRVVKENASLKEQLADRGERNKNDIM